MAQEGPTGPKVLGPEIKQRTRAAPRLLRDVQGVARTSRSVSTCVSFVRLLARDLRRVFFSGCMVHSVLGLGGPGQAGRSYN